MTDDVRDTLGRVTTSLPGGGEAREGQVEMASAVADAIADARHLVVQAGTGTGKSLAYLVPAVLSGRTVVVATATKALQEQLATKDLPLLAAQLPGGFTHALLKGRSNYVCVQRVTEVAGHGTQLTLGPGSADPPDPDDPLAAGREPGPGPGAPEPVGVADQVRRLVQWAARTESGDRAELDFEPSGRAWAMVSTTARECPGRYRCPSGQACFAEEARTRASRADVIVVNTHLYGAHLASGGAVLPEHEVVVFDEAHEVEDVMTDSLGVEIGPGRFRALSAAARPLVDVGETGGTDAADRVGELAETFGAALGPLAGRRVTADILAGAPDGTRPGKDEPDGLERTLPAPPGRPPRAPGGDVPGIAETLELATSRVARLLEALRRADRDAGSEAGAPDRSRRDRVVLAAGHLAADLERCSSLTADEVAWIEDGRAPSLRVAPIDVGPLLAEQLWSGTTGVLTSATVPLGLPERLGLPAGRTDQLDVGSPFDYRTHALLYVARDLPDRRRPEAEPALHDELEVLIGAAGGRTLALFTSWRAMRDAVAVLKVRLPFPILSQSDLPKPALVEAFSASEETCLFATLGFWQGIDLPGRTLSLVTIDRIPFPRPDDPVLEARRERAGAGAFSAVDLPRAGTLLAQGAGRLIRSSTDCGVVAVLDSRLATASYRRALLARIPPMQRTVDRHEVVTFLRALGAGSTEGAPT